MELLNSGADATDLYLPNDFIALAMGELAAQRLDQDRLELFRRDLDRLRSRSDDNAYFRAWDQIIAAGQDAVRRALTETSQRGQVLRSVIAFRVFVSKVERDEIFARYARNTEAMTSTNRLPPPPPPPKPGDMIEDARKIDSFRWLRDKSATEPMKPTDWQTPPPPPRPGDMIEDARKIDSFKKIRR